MKREDKLAINIGIVAVVVVLAIAAIVICGCGAPNMEKKDLPPIKPYIAEKPIPYSEKIKDFENRIEYLEVQAGVIKQDSVLKSITIYSNNRYPYWDYETRLRHHLYDKQYSDTLQHLVYRIHYAKYYKPVFVEHYTITDGFTDSTFEVIKYRTRK